MEPLPCQGGSTGRRVRLTSAERKALDGAAKGKGLDMSAWARMVLLSAAKGE